MRRHIAFTFPLVSLLSAAVVPRFSAEELISQSELIVQGKVGLSWTSWDSKHKYIWTHYTVAISDVIRGARLSSLIVSEPGGSLDGVSQEFSGSVPYFQGEDMVLFLYRVPIGYWRAVGGPQGKFAVATRGHIRGSTQVATYAAPAGRVQDGTSLASFEDLSIGEFKARVRQLAVVHPYSRAQ